MGFFFDPPARNTRVVRAGRPSDQLLRSMRCKVCPLNKEKLAHPKMTASGAEHPAIYVLGTAPGIVEDVEGGHFVGAGGQLLRSHVPRRDLSSMRWNNIVRCRPAKYQAPSELEIGACRGFIEEDIGLAKPSAVFAFGNAALKWALDQDGIGKWRGRRVPVVLGGHACWLYPFQHPDDLLKLRKYDKPSADEVAFKFDLRRAFDEVRDGLPEPKVVSSTRLEKNLVLITGANGSDDISTVITFLDEACRQKWIGVDYETSTLRPYLRESEILSVGISTKNWSMAFAWRHPQAGWAGGSVPHELRDAMARLFKSPARKAVHNLPFELEWSAVFFGHEFVRSPGWVDTLSQAAILDERVGEKPQTSFESRFRTSSCFSLGFLTTLHFGLNVKNLSSLDRKKLSDAPLLDVLRYNALDAKAHRMLGMRQHRLLSEADMLHVYNFHVERLPTFVLTQVKGIPLDRPYIDALSGKLGKQIAHINDKIAGDVATSLYKKQKDAVFNPGSSRDVTTMFRDTLRDPGGRQADGSYSTEAVALQKMRHPFAKLMLKWRQVSKIQSTYVTPLLANSPIVYDGDVLHPTINANFAETGRTTSQDPNEQNWPKRKEGAKAIRDQIAAKPGHVFVAVDYGQIEARVIAMMSKDAVFVKALWERSDIHAEWAERIARASPGIVGGLKFLNDKDVMKKFRDTVKGGWVFALFFDARFETAATQVGLDLHVARKLYDQFWSTFSGVKSWQDELKASYARKGYVECLTGRRRRAPLRPTQLVNAPIQGTASEIVVDAMNRLSITGDPDLQACMLIHDDLTFHIPEKQFEQKLEIILRTMVTVPFDFVNVPITVEVSVGKTWGGMEEIMKFSSDEGSES